MDTFDWQSVTAAAVVAATILAFVIRAIRRHRRSQSMHSCGTDCHCPAKKSIRSLPGQSSQPVNE